MSVEKRNDSGLGLTHAQFEVDEKGCAVILLDVQGATMNTLSTDVSEDLATICSKLPSNCVILCG